MFKFIIKIYINYYNGSIFINIEYLYFIIKYNETKEYKKGDPILFFSTFENKDEEPPVNLAAEQADKEEMDDTIPY